MLIFKLKLMTRNIFLLIIILPLLFACNKETESISIEKNLTIFFVNDVHAQIDNFSKVKHIVDQERLNTNVIVAGAGDMFTGNPVVDNHAEKGYPLIDIMNKIGFDVAAIGNHEFDYGPVFLKNRIEQSDFPWICANVQVNNTGVPQPPAYVSVFADDLKITFLGLIETGGKKNAVIPSSHPWKVKDFTFQQAKNVVKDYMHTKDKENADLFIALSHLGHQGYEGETGDFELAKQNYFFDLIIGGHSHAIIDTSIADIPIFQSGGYLHYLGKINLEIKDRSLKSCDFKLIDLDKYSEEDTELKSVIDEYNNIPELKEVIGYSSMFHFRSQVGCFYTDAMRQIMNVDVAFQNTGGVRSGLDMGDITKRDIFEIAPFNNGTVIYEMTVAEIKEFLIGSESGFYYSGIIIRKSNNEIQISDLSNREIPDDIVLSVGINDYIPAVHEIYFPDNGVVQQLTAAETIIAYLQNINSQVNYANCNGYFRY